VEEAADGATAIQLARERRFDVILCDIKMPRMDGMEVLQGLQELTEAPVVMISGHGTIQTAVEAIKKGAFDYIAKPLDLNRLLITLRNALDRSSLIEETKTLRKKIDSGFEIIGNSAAITSIKRMIERVAPTPARVLITGESGTGKELVARQLHALSVRSSGPFIEVNCAAIPSELIESQLFGHEKGSFTSALKQHKGDFEQAHGGTLFLDEVGDMSLSAQAKVLRALQENRITRVGGEKEIPIDVRVIAATNKNLEEEITAKRFRDDLYHRLGVILIHVPPLNDRVDDIPELAAHFMGQISAGMGKAPLPIDGDALDELRKLNWPGNIRQFRNVMERLIILCDGAITAEDVRQYA
jgi:DNA-binding NtrC family response regulator